MVQKAAEAFMGVDPRRRSRWPAGAAGTGSGRCWRVWPIWPAFRASCAPRSWTWPKNGGKKLHLVPVALGCVVPVVDPANPVKAVSLEQLRQIYSGEITNWKQLGGRDQPIAVMSRRFQLRHL